MKITISLPEDLFAAADALARRLWASRSELHATAVAEFLANHRDTATPHGRWPTRMVPVTRRLRVSTTETSLERPGGHPPQGP